MKNNTYYFIINSLEGGGAERATINFANNFIKEGKEVYIITLKSGNFYDLPQTIKHISLSKVHNNFLMFLLIPRYALKFKKILKKHNLFDGMSLLEVANFVHILAKKDAIISFRIHISFFKGFIGYIYKLLIKLFYPKAGKIIVNSLENRYDLAKYLHISESKIEVLYNTIDKEKIEKLKNEDIPQEIKKKIQGKKIFITTGRLVWQKHHEKIILALKQLYDSFDKDWTYLIVGDGPEKSKLHKLVSNLGLQNKILFCLEQKNVFKYLNIADVFVYASEIEGFPNVLLEAKEIGLPIITSDFKSGAKEVIIGKYTKDIGKHIKYPYYGKYGILLDLNHYEKQFLKAYKKL